MKLSLPMALVIERPQGLQWDVPPQAFEHFAANIRAAESDDASISVFDPIGADFWTGEGVTAKRISAALRSIGAENDVTVNINSPGGDLSEGLTIYNLLRQHKGQVTVKILGIAASAASIVAMAGDEIQIARAGFFMVHNSWAAAIGNRHDFRTWADELEQFDLAMADVYAARTALDLKAVQKKMDAAALIRGSAAVDEGWADALLPADAVKEDKQSTERTAAYQLDRALAKAGMPRSERRSLLQDYRASMPSAAPPASTPRAAEDSMPCAAVLAMFQQFNVPKFSEVTK